MTLERCPPSAWNRVRHGVEYARIGLEQLKSLLVNGGHPDPDNIGVHGVESINGLTVGVQIGSELYNGESRSRVKGYFNPDSAVTVPDSKPAQTSIGMEDDDIPF